MKGLSSSRKCYKRPKIKTTRLNFLLLFGQGTFFNDPELLAACWPYECPPTNPSYCPKCVDRCCV